MGKRGSIGLALTLAWIVASGCSDDSGSSSDVCTGGKQCVCDDDCEITCDATNHAGCQFNCRAGASCVFHCAGGGCQTSCLGASSCVTECPGNSCQQTCDSDVAGCAKTE